MTRQNWWKFFSVLQLECPIFNFGTTCVIATDSVYFVGGILYCSVYCLCSPNRSASRSVPVYGGKITAPDFAEAHMVTVSLDRLLVMEKSTGRLLTFE